MADGLKYWLNGTPAELFESGDGGLKYWEGGVAFAQQTSSTAITGTAALTETAATGSASGALRFTGTSALTEAAATLSASGLVGTVTVTGTAALTETAATMEATGTVPADETPPTLGFHYNAIAPLPRQKPPVRGSAELSSAPSVMHARGIVNNPIRRRQIPPAVKARGMCISSSGFLKSSGTVDFTREETQIMEALIHL